MDSCQYKKKMCLLWAAQIFISLTTNRAALEKEGGKNPQRLSLGIKRFYVLIRKMRLKHRASYDMNMASFLLMKYPKPSKANF